MIVVKTSRELEKMKLAGRVSAQALRLAGQAIEPGITTFEIDELVRKFIISEGAEPSF